MMESCDAPADRAPKASVCSGFWTCGDVCICFVCLFVSGVCISVELSVNTVFTLCAVLLLLTDQ